MAGNNEMIHVNHLTKKFGKLTVLDDISTVFCRGEVVSIIGPSGGGKSTFLRCLNLLEQPSSGEILFDGVNICDRNTDINQHRQKMGMVFQQFNLFENMNVLKNLTAAPVKIKKMPREQADEKAMQLLARVGLTDKAAAYPSQLSGGQKQRIAIVRALMMEPEVMLFDEPTSAPLSLGLPGEQDRIKLQAFLLLLQHPHEDADALRPGGQQPDAVPGRRAHRGGQAVPRAVRKPRKQETDQFSGEGALILYQTTPAASSFWIRFMRA